MNYTDNTHTHTHTHTHQMEYGEWSAVVERGEDSSEGVTGEALQRFCPTRFTHLTLEHDQRWALFRTYKKRG